MTRSDQSCGGRPPTSTCARSITARTTIPGRAPAGGTYGDPLEREPERVLDDVLDGSNSVEHVRDNYGVVLAAVDDGYKWALNEETTRALRAERRGA